jgi:hypothetical protein
MALGQRRAQFLTERAQHAVVAIVTLLDDPGEGCGRHAAIGAKFLHYCVAFVLASIRKLMRSLGYTPGAFSVGS